MFTGLVKGLGKVKDVAAFGKGRRFRIDLGALADGLAIGQSVAINGVCLTVTGANGNEATFDATLETVNRSNLGQLRAGDSVNLEPALKAGGALDGHIVLGHVDALGTVLALDATTADNRVIKISLPGKIRHLVAEKGSVAVDGISLTVAEAGPDWFTVTIIPLSWSDSTLSQRRVGDGVNLEVDVLARYAARIMQYGNGAAPEDGGAVTEALLKENGFA